MINTIADKPQLGDLVVGLGNDLGIISHIENDKLMCPYFIQWISGGLQGYTTAHNLFEIESWSKNL